MAIMVPPIFPRDAPSQGEREVFRRLRDDPGTFDWVVLHSLDLAEHEHRVSGEVDFVAIIPRRGVLCIEVKGSCTANLRRDDLGLWYYGPHDKGEARSPFSQAAQAMHSLRRQLLRARPALGSIQFSSAVVFPFARVREHSLEWQDWEAIDAPALRSAPISRLLCQTMDRARAHLLAAPQSPRLAEGAPTPEHCLEIRDALRGAFDAPVDRRARQCALQTELHEYTAEQFLALDAMADNPRTIFVGPAGVGKTLLAIEAARRARGAGRRVLFVCYNRLLGNWLERQTAGLRPEVTCTTLHRHMLAVSRQQVPSGAQQEFWEDTLPEGACDRLLEARGEDLESNVFDELVIDEAQDVLRDPYLDFLDLSLRGGWGAGRWRLFGDFEKAAIYHQANITLQQFREQRAVGAPMCALRVNCRNTPRVAEWVHLLARLAPRYQAVRRPDNHVQPEMRTYKDEESQRSLLLSILADLQHLGFQGEDIVVLSARPEAQCAASIKTAPWRDRLLPLERAKGGYVGWGTVRAYKGLEAPVVVVTDVDSIRTAEARDLFYVAITRALERLIILGDDRVRAEAVEALMGVGSNKLGRTESTET